MPLSTYYCYSYLLLHVAASAGGSTIWSFLPSCAQPCADKGTNAVSICDPSDYGCYCASAEFHLVTTCCVRASCDSYDDELVYTESEAFCSEYGVTVTSLAATACSTTYGAGPIATDAGTSALGTKATSVTDAAGSIITAPPTTVTETVSIAGGFISTVTYTYPAAAATDTSSSPSSGTSSGSSGGSSDGSSTSGLTSSNNTHNTLSTGAKIGIGIGAGVGGLLLIGLVAFGIYKCVTRGRGKQYAAVAAAEKVGEAGSGGFDGRAGEMYNNKSEMDGSHQLQQQQQQQQQQQNLSAPSHDGSATATSLVSSSLTGPSELQTIQQGYYQHPNGDAQELAAQYQYYEQQQQVHQQNSGWSAAQAEMPVNHEHSRNEMH